LRNCPFKGAFFLQARAKLWSWNFELAGVELMSAASIVHVGVDDCYRVAVLESAGFSVDNCASLAQLRSALIRVPPLAAVAITDGFRELPREAVSLTRASTSIPLVLFQGADHYLNEAEFDLVVPVSTSPQVWVDEVRRLVEESRAIRLRTAALCQEARLLRGHSASMREQSAATRTRSRLERLRSEIEIAKNRQR
jgi:hypothetical protein